MSSLKKLQKEKQRLDAGNPILSDEINTINTYFIPFIFDFIYDSGSCISNKEDLFIKAYHKNYDLFFNEYPQLLEDAEFKRLIDSELENSYFIVTNNFFHIVNKVQPVGISIDLASIKINLNKPNKILSKLQKITISGEVVHSNVSGINLGKIELELEMGKKTYQSVIQKINYFKLILEAISTEELQQQSFHTKKDSMFHYSFMTTYSEEYSEPYLFTTSRLLFEMSRKEQSIKNTIDQIVNSFMILEQNQKLNSENILKDSFITEKFIIFTHIISIKDNLISYNLMQSSSNEAIEFSQTPDFELIKSIYNLNFV